MSLLSTKVPIYLTISISQQGLSIYDEISSMVSTGCVALLSSSGALVTKEGILNYKGFYFERYPFDLSNFDCMSLLLAPDKFWNTFLHKTRTVDFPFMSLALESLKRRELLLDRVNMRNNYKHVFNVNMDLRQA